jgi:hypothetical protein
MDGNDEGKFLSPVVKIYSASQSSMVAVGLELDRLVGEIQMIELPKLAQCLC